MHTTLMIKMHDDEIEYVIEKVFLKMYSFAISGDN